MGNKGLSRRDREKLSHRREFVEAAERVFARDGYQGATVERIAQEADFAVGTLYNFFESKEKLFEEVIRKLSTEAFARLERQVFSERDPLAALEALIEVRLAAPVEHRDFGRIFVEMQPVPGKNLAQSLPSDCQELYRRYIRNTARIMERGMEQGVFRKADPLYVTLCLEGTFQIVGNYWVQQEKEEPVADAMAKVRDILLGMVCETIPVQKGNAR